MNARASKKPIEPDVPLTTGQVAVALKVAPRTVAKWFDSGLLKGYRVPGSLDRRIPHDSLIDFCLRHGIEIPVGVVPGKRATVAYGTERTTVCTWCDSLLSFGAVVADGPIGLAVLGDSDGFMALVAAAKFVRSHNPKARVVVVLSDDAHPDRLAEAGIGYAEVAARPLDWTKVLKEKM